MNQKGRIFIRLVMFFSLFVTLFGIDNKGFCEFLNSTKITSSSSQTIAEVQAQEYGSKPTIAVMEFDNKTNTQNVSNFTFTGSGVEFGRDPIGNGMKEQLVTALTQTNAFIVLERQALQDILGEQNLGASGRVKTEKASGIGEIEGANFLIYGAVTEYKAKQAGVGGGIGGKIGMGVAALGFLFKQTHVAIDIRIVDSQTGRIVNATSVEGKPKDLGGGIGGIFGGTLGGVVGQYKTPIQKAIRACMIKAVNWIADNLLEKNVYAKSSNKNSVTKQISNTLPITHKNVNVVPPVTKTNSIEDRLKILKGLKDKKLITEEKYNQKLEKILEEF